MPSIRTVQLIAPRRWSALTLVKGAPTQWQGGTSTEAEYLASGVVFVKRCVVFVVNT